MGNINQPDGTRYVQWTGDLEGVEAADGGYHAFCPDGTFWIAPACRGNTSECIPIISTGYGWGVHFIMQWKLDGIQSSNDPVMPSRVRNVSWFLNGGFQLFNLPFSLDLRTRGKPHQMSKKHEPRNTRPGQRLHRCGKPWKTHLESKIIFRRKPWVLHICLILFVSLP